MAIPDTTTHISANRAKYRIRRVLLHAVWPVSVVLAPAICLAELDLSGKVEITESYIDNVTLAPADADQEHDFITQLKPGLTLTQKNARAESKLDYEAQAVLFSQDSGRNQTYHKLEAITDAALVPNWFFIEVTALATQQVLDPSRPVGLETFLDTSSNVVDARSANGAPYFRHLFGMTLAEARYSYGIVNYDMPDSGVTVPGVLSDSTNKRTLLIVGTDPEQLGRFSWEARFDRQEAIYDAFDPYRYAKASMELGLGTVRSLRILVIGGYESDLFDDLSGGKLDRSYGQAGASMEFGRGHFVRAVAGRRFFGDDVEFSYRFTGRRLSLESSYSEGPTTAADELLLRPALGVSTVQGAITDSDLNRATSAVFIRKYLDTLVRVTGRRTELLVRVGDYKREYVTGTLGNDRTRQAVVTIDRELSSRNSIRVLGSWRDYRIVSEDSTIDLRVGLEFRRHLSQSMQLIAGAARIERSGPVASYDADMLTIGIVKLF